MRTWWKGDGEARGEEGLRAAPGVDSSCPSPRVEAAPQAPAQSGGKAEMTQPGHFHKTSFNISHENEEKAQIPLTGKKFKKI